MTIDARRLRVRWHHQPGAWYLQTKMWTITSGEAANHETSRKFVCHGHGVRFPLPLYIVAFYMPWHVKQCLANVDRTIVNYPVGNGIYTSTNYLWSWLGDWFFFYHFLPTLPNKKSLSSTKGCRPMWRHPSATGGHPMWPCATWRGGCSWLLGCIMMMWYVHFFFGV